MIFETHAHYEDERYNEDRNELILSMKNKNVGKIMDVCAEMKSIKPILELTEKYDFLYGSVGVHPDTVDQLTENDLKIIEETAKNEKILAIGEIGLDYHGEYVPEEIQKKWFEAQLDLALRLDMPVIIHSRDACEDTLEILGKREKLRAVMHCYSYSKEVADELVKKGYYIGVGGVVTFKNARKLKETVEKIPLESILLETDCPYMAPEPFRGTRNDSSLIKYVVEEIARIKGVSPQYVEEVTWENAAAFYSCW